MSMLPIFLLVLPVVGHEHRGQPTQEELNAPVDAILWMHIFLQVTVWGVLFPVGMILGMIRSRWHVPLQVRSQLVLEARFTSLTSLLEYGIRSDHCWLYSRIYA